MAEIHTLRKRGICPSQKYVVKNRPDLYGAGSRYFNSWRKALEAAGENPEQVTKESIAIRSKESTRWSREVIVETIRDRLQRGLPLHVQGLRQEGLDGFLAAAKRRFGSYRLAVEAAGLNYTDIRAINDWTSNPEKILEAIHQLSKQGCDLNISTVQFHRSGLVTAAIKHFGSWDRALMAAGFAPDTVRLDVNTESHKGRIFQNICYELFSILRPDWIKSYKYVDGGFTAYPDMYDPTNGTWIDFKLSAYGESVNTSIRKYSPYAPQLLFIFLSGKRESTEGIEFFSVFSFDKAITSETAKALFQELRNLEKYDPQRISHERWSKKWSNKQVTEFIKQLPTDKLSSSYAQINFKAEYKAAYRLFGGWYEAVEAAGIAPESVRRKSPTYTKADIDQFIQERWSNGEPLSAKAVCSFPEGNGKYQASARFYNCWEEALAANGIPYEGVREKSGKEKISKQNLDRFIRLRYSNGEALNALYIRDNFKGIYGAAHRIYGGWRKSIESNGIPYQKVSLVNVRRIIEKEDVDAFIQSRWARNEPLNATAVHNCARHTLTAACRKIYGSWKNAIEANGIPYDMVTLKSKQLLPSKKPTASFPLL